MNFAKIYNWTEYYKVIWNIHSFTAEDAFKQYNRRSLMDLPYLLVETP